MAALQEVTLDFDGIPIRAWRGGSGFPILMLHGSGAGASTMGNYRKVLEPLAERYTILAADLIGFGFSGRKPVEPFFDMSLWVDQADFLARKLSSGSIGFIGHSLASPIGLKLAGRTPTVTKFLATGTMGVAFKAEAAGRGWVYPEDRGALVRFMEGSVYDKRCIAPEDIAYRQKILAQSGYADYFRKMFAQPRQYYIDASALGESDLARVKCDVTFVHGAADKAWPVDQTAFALARSLTQADVVVLNRCGHGVAFEQPEKFLGVCRAFFG